MHLTVNVVGNTIIELLILSYNGITFQSLAIITMLLASTQLNRLALTNLHAFHGDKQESVHITLKPSSHETTFHIC